MKQSYKKSYFMKIYNLLRNLGLLVFTFAMLSVFLKILSLMYFKVVLNFPFKNQILNGIELLYKGAIIITLVVLVSLLFLILIELSKRLSNDSLLNLAKSIIATSRLRHFLKQYKITSSGENESYVQSENRIIDSFNHALNKSVIDLTRKELKLFIKIPKEAQSKEILNKQKDLIKQHIFSFYSEYIISDFKEEKFSLWIVGTKK